MTIQATPALWDDYRRRAWNMKPCTCGHPCNRHGGARHEGRCSVVDCPCRGYRWEAAPVGLPLPADACECGHRLLLHRPNADGVLVCTKAATETPPRRSARRRGEGVIAGPQWSSICACEEYRAIAAEAAA